tara:strand:+ start:10357 stop:11712 length:1356 start_codon:yes stop_codon:yes gene_type:complete
MSVRSQVYEWDSCNINTPSSAVGSITLTSGGDGYLIAQQQSIGYNSALSQTSTTGIGTGFQCEISNVRRLTIGGGNTQWGVGNAYVDGTFTDNTTVGTTYVYVGADSQRVYLTVTELTNGISPGTVSAWTINTNTGPLAPPNDNRLNESQFSFGGGLPFIDMFDTATSTLTLRLVLNTNADGGTGLGDSNYTQAGTLFGLPNIVNGGSNYQVGDIITLDKGAAGLLSNATIQGKSTDSIIESNAATVTVASVVSCSSLPLGQPFSIFTGGYGNNLKNPAKANSNQFIVIENYGATPTDFVDATKGIFQGDSYRGNTVYNQMSGPRAYIQFSINTTGYFKDPDGVARQGIPANNFPYPETEFNLKTSKREIPVYVLPGQTWDAQLTLYNGGTDPTQTNTNQDVKAFMKYTLYDGPDALIAMKLMKSGIKVTPTNVDNFRKKMIEQNMFEQNS